MTPQTPEWVKHAIFYQIFPDRFATSSRVPKPSHLEAWHTPPTTYGFKGGDLLGVVEKLDYLKELGINAIYFTPVFASTANHRYHTFDYYAIDPILGGNEAFKELLKQAHQRKIRVVIDGVFNHASRGFYQFNHALENGKDSPYLDWFNIKGFPLHAYDGSPNYDCWWGIPALPKLNTRTNAVREFIFKVAEYWIAQGADGWRLDVPGEINDDSFWQEFRARVKAINPNAYIVGEIWHEAQRWLRGDQFDAVMNYQFTKACLGFFIKDRDEWLASGVGYAPVRSLDASSFADAIQHNLALYHTNINTVQLNLLDSHDTARFLSIAKGDVSALKLATLFQMTFIGAPSIYYGDEIGMMGGKDPDCRRSFEWNERKWDHELYDEIRALIALRNKYEALRTGAFVPLYASGDVMAYARADDKHTLIVCINAGDQDVVMDVPVANGVREGAIFKRKHGNTQAQVTAHDGALRQVKIPARQGCVFAN
jgi:neopullulanase